MNAFSKIVGILIAVVLMFLCPIQYTAQKQDILMQQYVTTETSYFIDSVRNLGYVTKQMYEEYMRKIDLGNNLYDVELTHYHVVYYKEEGEQVDADYNETSYYVGEKEETYRRYMCYYTPDILEQLYTKESEYSYLMSQDDYLTIKVKQKNNTLGKRLQELFLGTDYTDGNYVTIYGGLIRDEAY
ncbi:hypothetical protein [Anaerosporobacter sp.]